jgi:hypothetical protein
MRTLPMIDLMQLALQCAVAMAMRCDAHYARVGASLTEFESIVCFMGVEGFLVQGPGWCIHGLGALRTGWSSCWAHAE